MTPPKNPPSNVDLSDLQVTQAEMILWLPGRAQIRREILRVEQSRQVFEQHPDANHAGGISLTICQNHFQARISGPERADLEVECIIKRGSVKAIPLWAVAHGPHAEISLWDSFGKLVVPDLLSRSLESPGVLLHAGKYLLVASVSGYTSAQLGMGIAAIVSLSGLECGGQLNFAAG